MSTKNKRTFIETSVDATTEEVDAKRQRLLQMAQAVGTLTNAGFMSADNILSHLGYAKAQLPITMATAGLLKVIHSRDATEQARENARVFLKTLNPTATDMEVANVLAVLNIWSSELVALRQFYASQRGITASGDKMYAPSSGPPTRGSVWAFKYIETVVFKPTILLQTNNLLNFLHNRAALRLPLKPTDDVWRECSAYEAMKRVGEFNGPVADLVAALATYRYPETRVKTYQQAWEVWSDLCRRNPTWKAPYASRDAYERALNRLTTELKRVTPTSRVVIGVDELQITADIETASYFTTQGVNDIDTTFSQALLSNITSSFQLSKSIGMLQEMVEVAQKFFCGFGEPLGQLIRINSSMKVKVDADRAGGPNHPKNVDPIKYYTKWYARYYNEFLRMEVPARDRELIQALANTEPSKWFDLLYTKTSVPRESAQPHQLLTAAVDPDDETRILMYQPNYAFNGTSWDTGAGFPFGKNSKLKAYPSVLADQDDTWNMLRSGKSVADVLELKPDYKLIQLKAKNEVYELRAPHASFEDSTAASEAATSKFLQGNFHTKKVRCIWSVPFITTDKAQLVSSLIDSSYKPFYEPVVKNGKVTYPLLEGSVVPLKAFTPVNGATDLIFRRVQKLPPFTECSDDPLFFVFSDNCYVVFTVTEPDLPRLREVNPAATLGDRVWVSIDGAKMEASSGKLKCYVADVEHLRLIGVTEPSTPVLFKFLHGIAQPSLSGGLAMLGPMAIQTDFCQSGTHSTFFQNDGLLYLCVQSFLDSKRGFTLPSLLAHFENEGVFMTIERVIVLPAVHEPIVVNTDTVIPVDLLGFSVTAIRHSNPFDSSDILVVPTLQRDRYFKAMMFDKYPSKKVSKADKAALKAVSLVFAGAWTDPAMLSLLSSVIMAGDYTNGNTLRADQDGQLDLFFATRDPSLSKFIKDCVITGGVMGVDALSKELVRRCSKLVSYPMSLQSNARLVSAEPGPGGWHSDFWHYDMVAQATTPSKLGARWEALGTTSAVARLHAVLNNRLASVPSKLLLMSQHNPEVVGVEFDAVELLAFALKFAAENNVHVTDAEEFIETIKKLVALHPSLSTDYGRVKLLQREFNKIYDNNTFADDVEPIKKKHKTDNTTTANALALARAVGSYSEAGNLSLTTQSQPSSAMTALTVARPNAASEQNRLVPVIETSNMKALARKSEDLAAYAVKQREQRQMSKEISKSNERVNSIVLGNLRGYSGVLSLPLSQIALEKTSVLRKQLEDDGYKMWKDFLTKNYAQTAETRFGGKWSDMFSIFSPELFKNYIERYLERYKESPGVLSLLADILVNLGYSGDRNSKTALGEFYSTLDLVEAGGAPGTFSYHGPTQFIGLFERAVKLLSGFGMAKTAPSQVVNQMFKTFLLPPLDNIINITPVHGPYDDDQQNRSYLEGLVNTRGLVDIQGRYFEISSDTSDYGFPVSEWTRVGGDYGSHKKLIEGLSDDVKSGFEGGSISGALAPLVKLTLFPYLHYTLQHSIALHTASHDAELFTVYNSENVAKKAKPASLPQVYMRAYTKFD